MYLILWSELAWYQWQWSIHCICFELNLSGCFLNLGPMVYCTPSPLMLQNTFSKLSSQGNSIFFFLGYGDYTICIPLLVIDSEKSVHMQPDVGQKMSKRRHKRKGWRKEEDIKYIRIGRLKRWGREGKIIYYEWLTYVLAMLDKLSAKHMLFIPDPCDKSLN